MAGLITSLEAAIAWRNGNSAARVLAGKARRFFEEAGYGPAALFARAIELASGERSPNEAESLAREACAIDRPDIGIEVLGMLARSGQLQGNWIGEFEAQAARIPGRPANWRSGALSIEEARDAVARAAA